MSNDFTDICLSDTVTASSLCCGKVATNSQQESTRDSRLPDGRAHLGFWQAERGLSQAAAMSPVDALRNESRRLMAANTLRSGTLPPPERGSVSRSASAAALELGPSKDLAPSEVAAGRRPALRTAAL